MLLAIGQKSYIDQKVARPDLHDSLSKIKDALKAFEGKNKQLAVKTFYKAYSFLPRNTQGIRVCGDIVETLMQIEAYEAVIQVARDIEGQYHAHYFHESESHFDMFRIFANAAEAHEHLGNTSQARRFSKMALDHHLETQDKVDLEMLQLFTKQADQN